MYHLIYVFISFISIVTAKEDYFPIKIDKRDTYRLQIEVDEWKGIFENYSPLTLQGDGNYFINYQKFKRDIIEKDTFTFRGETIGRTLVYKEMKIGDISTKLLFYFIPTYASPFGLSLSLGVKNESSSLLHTLYKEKKISNLKFGFYFPPSTPLNGTLYIGGIDANLIKNTRSSQCRSNETYWGCKLHKITFNSNNSLVFENTFVSFFQSEYHPIYCPIEFLEYIKQNFLKDLFESDICRYHDFGSSSKYTQIRCQNLTSVYNALPEYLNFDFGGNLLRIPMINLTNSFTEIGKDYVVINMFFAERDVRNDQWNFGMNFFINFVTLFDYEEKTVTFYSNENIIPSTFLPKESIKSFAIAAIAILFLGCLLLIVIIYDMNK